VLAILGLMLVESSASAQVVPVTFCAKYKVNFGDANPAIGDDEFVTNANKKARGVRVQVIGGPTTLNYYTADTGSNAGCTPGMALDSAQTYDVRIYSEAEVSGVHLRVESDSGSLFYSLALDNWSPSPGTFALPTAGTHDSWNILSATGWALSRRPAGIGYNNNSLTFHLDDCPQTTSEPGADVQCSVGEDLYFLGNGPDYKYLVVHELGHSVASIVNGGSLYQPIYSNDPDLCWSNTTDAEFWGLNSKEWSAVAATEGIATFYAAVIFNSDGAGANCHIEQPYIDWDLSGDFSNDTDFPSCDLGPYGPGQNGPISNFDYLGEDINVTADCLSQGATVGVSTTYDYVRHFWDLRTGTNIIPLSVAEIFEIWDSSNPHNWTLGWAGSGNGYPAHELQQAADAKGASIRWSTQAALNGVDR
jgi:hypothetical protein